MRTTKTIFSRKLLFTLLTITLLFTIIHLILQYINTVHFNLSYGNFYEVTNRFDFDDEASIPTWFSNVLFLMAASAAGLAAYLERKKKSFGVWLLIMSGAILGSIDEVSTVHESGLQSIHLLFFNENAPTLLANAWVVIVPVVLIFIAWFFVLALRVLPKKTIKLFAIAAAIYLSGAIGVDIITSTLLDSTPFIEQGIFVAIEEVSELVGLSILIYAISSYIETNYSDRVRKAIKELK